MPKEAKNPVSFVGLIAADARRPHLWNTDVPLATILESDFRTLWAELGMDMRLDAPMNFACLSDYPYPLICGIYSFLVWPYLCRHDRITELLDEVEAAEKVVQNQSAKTALHTLRRAALQMKAEGRGLRFASTMRPYVHEAGRGGSTKADSLRE